MLKAFYFFSKFQKIFWVSFYSKFAAFFSKWWKKYLSKRSLIKHVCLWNNKLIVLGTLNRQAKIFLRIAYWIMKISWKHHTGGWGKNISKKPCKVKRGRKVFIKRKKFSEKYTISITFTTLEIAWSICLLGFYKDKNTKLLFFFFYGANHSWDSRGSTSPINNIFSIRADLVLS